MKAKLALPLIVIPSLLALSGCQSTSVSQKSGSELSGNKLQTYVSPEEYDKMTDAERKRLNATVGVSASGTVWSSGGSQSRDLKSQDLDRAIKNSK